jgi:hypothetical protein
MTETARLRLPEIAAAQAQKHVTHNEALVFLDTLVQASVIDKDLTAPPGSPAEGDCYIVAGSGGTATGAWASWEKRLARFQDGQWISFLPGVGSGIGWTCWVQDENTLYTFDGTNWVNALRGKTGGGISIQYTFSTTTTDSDPGAGVLRLNQATQNTATVIRADLLDVEGKDWTAALDSLDDSTNTVKGHIRLFSVADPAKWLLFTVSAVASPSGYRNITVALVASSAASPFGNGDGIVLSFTRAGDKGQDGAAGGGADDFLDLTDTPASYSGAAAKGVAVNSAANALEFVAKREVLTASRTYYVRTDGSDSNTGLVDSAGGAFLTVQKAFDTICTLDLGGYTATVQIKDGTYTGGINLDKPWVGGAIVFQGNSGTPANVVISTTSDDCFSVDVPLSSLVTIKDMKLMTATSGFGIVMNALGLVKFQNLNFGAAANDHLRAQAPGAKILCTGNYAVSGGGQRHFRAQLGGNITVNSVTVTLSGTPAFSSAFADAANVSVIDGGGITFSGSATGKRYNADRNAVVDSAGGGASYFPGNSAGTTATGGQYV